MNLSEEFWLYLFLGWGFVFAQAIAAYVDGYHFQGQMRYRLPQEGYSLMEHGGMWADVFLISPITAYILSVRRECNLHFVSVAGFAVLACILVLFGFLGRGYAKASLKTPEAHAHHGRTTWAGWFHVVFATIAAWVIAMYYLSAEFKPHSLEFCFVTLALSPFFALGAMKFNKRYKFDSQAMAQVTIGMIVLSAVCWFRVFGYKLF